MATLTATGVNTSNGTLDGFYTGTTVSNSSYPIGSYVKCVATQTAGADVNETVVIRIAQNGNGWIFRQNYPSGGTVLAGTWRCRGGGRLYCPTSCCYKNADALFQRVA